MRGKGSGVGAGTGCGPTDGMIGLDFLAVVFRSATLPPIENGRTCREIRTRLQAARSSFSVRYSRIGCLAVLLPRTPLRY